MPVILYAEFTAKPGSESEVETLISGLAEDVRANHLLNDAWLRR